jgi:ligand-binding sensor domain-containing protein
METIKVKPIRYKPASSSVVVITGLTLLLLLALGVIGCGSSTRRSGIQIIPLSSRSVLELNADDVVRVMRRAGFSDKQILEYGPDLRDGLAQSGAVQVKIGSKVEAVFAINLDHGPCIYITTRLRGSFIYNVQTGWVGGG